MTRGRDIRREIYYTVSQSRELSRGKKGIDQKIHSQLKSNFANRDSAQQSVVETIVDGRLERLAGAHYRHTLRSKAYYALNCNTYQGQQS